MILCGYQAIFNCVEEEETINKIQEHLCEEKSKKKRAICVEYCFFIILEELSLGPSFSIWSSSLRDKLNLKLNLFHGVLFAVCLDPEELFEFGIRGFQEQEREKKKATKRSPVE